MMIKYRVSDVAKDFGRPNKEISTILGTYLQAPKSNAQALHEEELDVIFEHLTQNNQVESLDQVFAPAAEAAAKRRQYPCKGARLPQGSNSVPDEKRRSPAVCKAVSPFHFHGL